MITEFADQNFNGGPQASASEISTFMNDALKFIDETDWIALACPFGAMSNLQGVNPLDSLMASGGGPSELGKIVINNVYS